MPEWGGGGKSLEIESRFNIYSNFVCAKVNVKLNQDLWLPYKGLSKAFTIQSCPGWLSNYGRISLQ